MRLDALQRKRNSFRSKRIADEDSYCCDEFSIVIKAKSKTSYNRKGAESNQVKEVQDLTSRAASGLVTFRYGGQPINKIHVVFPLAPTKIYGVDDEGNKIVTGWDTRKPASDQIKKEMKGWKKYGNVIPLFWKSGMVREPVIRAYGKDLLKWTGSSNTEKQLQLDWYDSHTDSEFLTTLKTRGNIITMFYPNRCTDILATCDGGLIKSIQDHFKSQVDEMLETYYDQLTGSDTLSKRIQRNLVMSSMNEAISEITTVTVQKVARRCGALFDLHRSLEEQFRGVKLRGYTVGGAEEVRLDEQYNYRNVFEGVGEENSVEVRRSWKQKESSRIRKQKKKKQPKKKTKKRKNKGKERKPRKKRKLPRSSSEGDDEAEMQKNNEEDLLKRSARRENSYTEGWSDCVQK